MNFEQTLGRLQDMLGRRVGIDVRVGGESTLTMIGTLAGPADPERVRKLVDGMLDARGDELSSRPAFREMVTRTAMRRMSEELAGDDHVRFGFEDRPAVEGFSLRREHFLAAEWVPNAETMLIALQGGTVLEIRAG